MYTLPGTQLDDSMVPLVQAQPMVQSPINVGPTMVSGIALPSLAGAANLHTAHDPTPNVGQQTYMQHLSNIIKKDSAAKPTGATGPDGKETASELDRRNKDALVGGLKGLFSSPAPAPAAASAVGSVTQ